MSTPTKQIWLCDLTHTFQSIAIRQMPIGIGLIAAYCQQVLKEQVGIRLFKFTEELTAALQDSEAPFIIGFSNFMWNQNLNLEVSKRLKEQFPKATIVFGGFNFPNAAEERATFLQQHPWIDFYIPGEGERAFTNLTQLLIEFNGDLGQVKEATPADTVFLRDNRFITGEIVPRMDIAENPSPYLMGLFDQYFNKLHPLVQTVRGCPFSCAYCSEGGRYWSKISHRNPKNVAAELEYIAQHCDSSQILFISDTNFAMYEQDITTCTAIGEIQRKYSWPWQMNVTTGKNRKERVLEAARLTNGAFGVSASLQSTDAGVLRNVKRHNVSTETLVSLAQQTKRKGNSHCEIILALPGDSRETHFQTLKDVVNTNLNTIIPIQFMFLPAMALASKELREQYGMQTKYRVVSRCFGRYPWLAESGDTIQAAEFEEICVASHALSFADYLDCRRLHLTITMFYNDSLLDGFTSVLSALGHSVFDFICSIQEKALRTEMGDIYQRFIQETQDELFESPQALYDFIGQEGVMEKYRQGEYGSNLLAKYRSMAMIQHMDLIISIAASHLKEIIRTENTTNMPWLFAFIDELAQYKSRKLINFLDTDSSYEENFTFDITSFLNKEVELEQVESARQVIRFSHTQAQKEIIEKNKAFFGSDIKGLSKMFANTNLNALFRTVEIRDGVN